MTGFDERMEQLRARFRARAVADREALIAALGAGEQAEIRSLAHGLSGAGGTFGYPAVSEAAEKVELLVDAGADEVDLDQATQALLTILGALD